MLLSGSDGAVVVLPDFVVMNMSFLNDVPLNPLSPYLKFHPPSVRKIWYARRQVNGAPSDVPGVAFHGLLAPVVWRYFPAFHNSTCEGVEPLSVILLNHVPKSVRCVPVNFPMAFLLPQFPLFDGILLQANDCQASRNWPSYLSLSIKRDFRPSLTYPMRSLVPPLSVFPILPDVSMERITLGNGAL